jgi:hypothetical protein
MNFDIDLSEADKAMNAALGFTSGTALPDVGSSFTDEDEQKLAKIITSGDKDPLDTTRSTSAQESGLSEYLQPYKDILEQKLTEKVEDTTDYSKEAREKFGEQFSAISTREQFVDELVFRKERDQVLESDQYYNQLLDVEKGNVDKTKIVVDQIRNKMQKSAAENFETFDEDKYNTAVAKFVAEGGALNPEGERLYKSIESGLLGYLSELRKAADTDARKAVADYKTNQSALDSEIKTFDILGIQLGDELGYHIQDFIRSGKLEEWEEETNLTPQQAAQRKILTALVANPKAFYTFLHKFAERSEEYGVNKVARKKF